ncbi:MAG: NB-ARC domain-containing protein [Chloroflexota bacterium]
MSIENSSDPNLIKPIQAALRNWNKENADSFLNHLYIVRQTARERMYSLRTAEKQIITEQLGILKDREPQLADTLESRFMDNEVVSKIMNRYNIAESTVYSHQSKGIRSLATLIDQYNEDARTNLDKKLKKRLEAPTTSTPIGLEDHIRDLQELLKTSSEPWIIAFEGIGGIGKTTLAHHLASRIIDEGLFDGVGWVTARRNTFNLTGRIDPLETTVQAQPNHASQSGANIEPKALLNQLISQLIPELAAENGIPYEERLSRLQLLLKEVPHLIVIDNLETVDDVEVLLPDLKQLTNPTKIILTSRERYSGRTPPYLYPVNELNEARSIALIRQEASATNLPVLASASKTELRDIYTMTGGNPLALRLVVGQAHIHPLKVILEDFKLKSGKAGGAVEQLYEFIYRNAWGQLDELERTVLLSMPLLQPAGDDVDHIIDISGLNSGEVRKGLNKLVLLNLVDVLHEGLNVRRYSIHGLTRSFLYELIHW